MKSWRSACFLVLLCFVAQARAQNPKDEAKRLFKKASSEGDRQRVDDECEAVRLDPKTTDYSRACEADRRQLIDSDSQALTRAQNYLSNKDLAHAKQNAQTIANSIDPGIASKAKQLLEEIAGGTQPSPGVVDQTPQLIKAQTDWKNGDLDDAATAARGITDPKLKALAQSILDDIASYRKDIDDAKKLEVANPQEAENDYRAAYGLNPKGPGTPKTQADRLQAILEASVKPATGGGDPKPLGQTGNNGGTQQKPGATTGSVDTSHPLLPVDWKGLLAGAHSAETGGRWPAALSGYESVLRTQPGNQEAKDGITRVQLKVWLADAQREENEGKLQAALHDYGLVLNSQKDSPEAIAGIARVNLRMSPKELEEMLIKAIRDFYDSRFSDAKAELGLYKNAPQARSLGAAYFYLGASVLEESILNTAQPKKSVNVTPTEVLADFQEARKAGYKPVTQFVSPKLLAVWNSAGTK